MILLKENADLSGVKSIKNKIRKGQFVYETLRAFAEKKQKNLRSLLDKMAGAPYRPYFIVNTIAAELTIDQMEQIAELDEVREIVPNAQISVDLPKIETDDVQNRAVEWGVSYIEADLVWALGFTGQGVIVGGQDTGYKWDHEALINQYRGYDSESMTADHNYNWHDAITFSSGNPCPTPSPFPCDDNSHGTHTMGTMVGTDGGANEIGVAPGAKWMACRNMDQGDGTPETYLDCFQWFLAPTNIEGFNPNPALAPHVINNSWACPPDEGCVGGSIEMIRQAVISLKNAGIVVVVSNGNNGSNCNTTIWPPALFQESFGVGATNSSGVIAGFSSRGPGMYNSATYLKPDVSAPGVSIRSSTNSGGYGNSSGTSMAGPHVAGAVALIISANPGLAGQVEEIEDILIETTQSKMSSEECGGIPSGTVPNNTYGHGIINALSAVQAALQFLDVSLLSFEAGTDGKKVKIQWEFDELENIRSWQLMRSQDGKIWEAITSSSVQSISDSYYADNQAKSGTNYYRLDWIEQNTDALSSPIRAVNYNQSIIKAYPNPVSELINFALQGENDEALSLQILDLLGRVVFQKQLEFSRSGVTSTNIGHLQQGLYVLVLKNSNKDRILQVEKLLKK